VIVGLLFTGCAGGAATPAPTTAPAAQSTAAKTTAAQTSAAAAPAAQGAVDYSKVNIKIGFMGALTGPVKTFGESAKNGFDLAVDEAKKAGAKIEVVVVDDRADATEAANGASKLINQDKVNAIMGSVTSGSTISASELVNAAKIPMITGTASNLRVTVDNGKRKEFVFRACFTDPFQGSTAAKFALTTLKAKKAAVLFANSDDYSKGLAESFRDAFKAGSGSVNVYESYGKDDVDFAALLTKVAADNPDVIFIPAYYDKVNLIAKQAKEKGIKGTMLGVDGWDSSEMDLKATDGSYFVNHYSPADPRPVVQDFVAKYKAKYGSTPDALASLGYDATNILLSTVAQVGSNDGTKVKDALTNMKPFNGVTGSISFDKDGNPVKSVSVLKIKDGKVSFVEEVKP
jgi:branched-chain amino acid transport system substrate-binding protein